MFNFWRYISDWFIYRRAAKSYFKQYAIYLAEKNKEALEHHCSCACGTTKGLSNLGQRCFRCGEFCLNAPTTLTPAEYTNRKAQLRAAITTTNPSRVGTNIDITIV